MLNLNRLPIGTSPAIPIRHGRQSIIHKTRTRWTRVWTSTPITCRPTNTAKAVELKELEQSGADYQDLLRELEGLSDDEARALLAEEQDAS